MIDPYPYEWPLIIPKNVGMYAMRFVPRDNPSDVFTLMVKTSEGLSRTGVTKSSAPASISDATSPPTS